MMMNYKSAALIFLLLLGIHACGSYQDPVKPASVPEDAVWAGGVDGGRWGLCIKKEEFQYYCEIYDDTNGYLYSFGNYLHRIVNWDSEKDNLVITIPSSPLNELHFEYFDSHFIELKGDDALVADGLIVYPDSDGSGLVVKEVYKEGVLNSEEKIDKGTK